MRNEALNFKKVIENKTVNYLGEGLGHARSSITIFDAHFLESLASVALIEDGVGSLAQSVDVNAKKRLS